MRPSTDAGPTTRGRRLVNGQIPTLANRLHISPSKIIRRANIGPTISTERLGCSRWPNVGRTLACQLRRSTNHADHVPTLDQRLVADWVTPFMTLNLYLVLAQYDSMLWVWTPVDGSTKLTEWLTVSCCRPSLGCICR